MSQFSFFISKGSNPSSVEFLSNYTTSCEPPTKMARLMDSPSNNNPTNTSSTAFDAPKRTRFTFRPEHLDVKQTERMTKFSSKTFVVFFSSDLRKSFYR